MRKLLLLPAYLFTLGSLAQNNVVTNADRAGNEVFNDVVQISVPDGLRCRARPSLPPARTRTGPPRSS